MMRLPRFLPSVVIACFSVALPTLLPQTLFAQESATAPAADPALRSGVDAFWHFAKTFRYDMAAAEAKKIVDAKPDATTLLKAFESVSQERKDNLDQWMLRWQQVPELRGSIDSLNGVLAEGYRLRRADQSAIEANIKRLPDSEQSYAIALNRLRESGQLAAPLMLEYLRDPSKAQYHSSIQRALVDMGRSVLSPLVAVLEAPINDSNQKMVLVVISALSEIGYDVSVAPLAYLANNATVPAVVKTAAKDALVRMGAGEASSMDASQLYYELAQKFYYGKAATSADPRSNVAFFWTWTQDKGLVKLDVPSPIYGDLMTMRSALKSLRINSNREDSLSLWLSADYGREVRLPKGATDPTRTEQTPSAHYYGVASGAKYLNNVITRALGDRDTGVALSAVRSLQRIGGESNLFAAGQSGAIVAAMQYPDRLVRFEAAFAAAGALPQSNFEGQDRVVPILAEAVAQTGQPHVVVIMPEAQLNARVQELKTAGYVAVGVTTAEAAAGAALPSVDILLVSDEDPAQVQKLRDVAAATPRLQGAAMVIITKTQASPFAVWATSNPLISVTQASKIEDLKAVLEAARVKAGSMPVDPAIATDYALRATKLLGQLAISRGQILDLRGAQSTLLQALDDSRPEIVMSAGNVLGLIDTPETQAGLLIKATDEKTEKPVKLSVYGSLATNAKFFGNKLSAENVQALQKAAIGDADLEIRSAAAEAHGALNLPPDQLKSLMLGK